MPDRWPQVPRPNLVLRDSAQSYGLYLERPSLCIRLRFFFRRLLRFSFFKFFRCASRRILSTALPSSHRNLCHLSICRCNSALPPSSFFSLFFPGNHLPCRTTIFPSVKQMLPHCRIVVRYSLKSRFSPFFQPLLPFSVFFQPGAAGCCKYFISPPPHRYQHGLVPPKRWSSPGLR